MLKRLCFLLLFVCACSSTPARPDVSSAPPDAWTSASAFASDIDAARLFSADAQTLLADWPEGHVLRVWRDGLTWRALIAPRPDAQDGPAAVLTLARDDDGAVVVTDIAPGDATALWPTL